MLTKYLNTSINNLNCLNSMENYITIKILTLSSCKICIIQINNSIKINL